MGWVGTYDACFKALDLIISLNPKVIVPGHGPVCGVEGAVAMKDYFHWHDLRHEYASRLVERGVPLAQVRDLLGHASITTTERYDNQTWETLQAAAGRLESGKVFEKRNPGATGATMLQGLRLVDRRAARSWRVLRIRSRSL